MSIITIRNLVVFARHGVFEEEARMGQKFTITAELEVDTTRSARHDDLELSVDYGRVCREITEFENDPANRVKLIETAATKLAEYLLLTEPLVKAARITLQKPWAPIGLPLDYASVTVERKWVKAAVSLGSNLGESISLLNYAVIRLKACEAIRMGKTSSVYRTAPYGVTDQPEFYNSCVTFETFLEPEELLEYLQEIEAEGGRERKEHWGPRTLDLDLLFYGDRVIRTERLVVPHPQIAKRMFVLEPLKEIDPYLPHPLTGKTVEEMWEELREKQKASGSGETQEGTVLEKLGSDK